MNHFDPDKRGGDQERQIASKYYPLIGPYDSSDSLVIDYHLLQMKICGIDGVIVDWYGLSDYRDYPILHRNTTRVLQRCEKLKMKFVICYEDQTIPALVEAQRIPDKRSVEHAVDEITWLGKYWFKSPSYVRFRDIPVMLSFGHDGLTPQQWSEALDSLSTPLHYYSQDFRRRGAVGGFNWPSPHEGLIQYDRFLKLAKEWPSFIPVAFPRFDDIYQQAAVSAGFPVIPDREGQTLRETLKRSVNPKAKIIQIATWNDWGEGTQVEPSKEYGYRDLEIIQSFVQANLKQLLKFQPSDLRYPKLLYDLRRQVESLPPQLIDKAIDAIVNDRPAELRELLQPYLDLR